MRFDSLYKLMAVFFCYSQSSGQEEAFDFLESSLSKNLNLKQLPGHRNFAQLLDALTPESLATFKKALMDAKQSVEAHSHDSDFEWRGEFICKNGVRISIEARGNAEITQHGAYEIHGFFFESKKDKVIQALEEEKTILNNVLANIPHSVFWKDKNSIYLGCNERFLKDANVATKADVIGKSDFDMPWGAVNAESYRQYDSQLMSSGLSILNLEETQQQADGSHTHVITSKVPLLDKENRTFGILGIYMDVTEHYMTQQRLSDQQDMMHATAKMAALGEMAAGIAHEINNPVAIIAALCDEANLALDDHEHDIDLVRHNFKTIEATLERISKIVSGLSSIARHGKGDAASKINLSNLLEELYELCKNRFRRHGVDLVVPAVSPDLYFVGRATDFSQVLLNLLNNSFDAVQSLSTRWVRIECQETERGLEIRVTDSGFGITPTVQEKMFQPFFTTKQVGKGTGLGLAISSGLVLAMGGEFTYNPNSKHTQFLITLPKAIDQKKDDKFEKTG